MMSDTAMKQAYAKLPARDVERARAFYADKLDLTPFGEHNGHLFYELGGTHFMVYPSSGAASGTAPCSSACRVSASRPSRRWPRCGPTA